MNVVFFFSASIAVISAVLLCNTSNKSLQTYAAIVMLIAVVGVVIGLIGTFWRKSSSRLSDES